MAGPTPNPIYPTQFRSKFAPKYHYQPTVAGLNAKQLTRFGTKLAGFGGVALFGVIFYVSNVPRVRSDVLQSIPFFNRFFVKEPIPASDNPF
ncbi:ubiquinol-cytochrome-c reductase complex subunit-domain-containing protein [Plectosphaerella cucumerina]|uniref:Ubiquinol-cytochrome-c reductase complex subunit-domain-containing protein n=1 Tax=Plectosphaerella cucumerina TaxID=40658 RepID=A0A8K0TPA0_9PEZI|nr:ubiquinol-cytochrome-c reductase complex subunit-domain-containing protein [Plectosphaerella cucumerina]